MSKLNIYNQKMLAILGTFVVLALFFGFIFGAWNIISHSISNTRNREISDNSLVVQVSNNQDTSQTQLIKQEVSFGIPKLIDTLASLYLIPISQVNLEEPIIENYSGKSNNEITFRYGSKRAPRFKYSGVYNNIMLYDQLRDQQYFVFNQKIYLTEFSSFIIKDKNYIFITGAHEDTNNDGKLNYKDLKSFFIYDITNQELTPFLLPHHSFHSHHLLYETENILLRYQVDLNDDGEINEVQEPIIIKRLNLSSMELKDFVDHDQAMKLTQLINQ